MSAEFDYVLVNRSKHGGRYHRPVRTTFGYSTACGAGYRDMAQVDESVAIDRYKRERCGKCWKATS